MGFLDYAGSLSLQKDPLKVKILLDPRLTYPTMRREGEIPVIRLPEPRTSEETIEYLGYIFPNDEKGKIRVGRLFRAAVAHVTAHTLTQLPPMLKAQSHLAKFTDTLLRNLHIDIYVAAAHPERLVDLAYANALAVASARRLEKIYLPATRVMTAILSTAFVGRFNGRLTGVEKAFVEEASEKLSQTKRSLVESLSEGEEVDVEELRETAVWLAERLREFGPFVETPCFPHTENASPCSIYLQRSAPQDQEVEPYFIDAMEALGGELPEEPMASCWKKQVDVECLQVFSSTIIQREKEVKILGKLQERLSPSRFRSIEIPPEDYSEYLRSREMIGGSTRRLLNNIIIATNFALEDIRKRYGNLDLAEAMQVVASKSPRTDVFIREEIMKQSFCIVVLLDVSRSMKTSPMENRARAICLAEAAKDIITDSNSWAFYAFSDTLYVLKDGSEAYSRRVRARLGGVPFDGATYMPDALNAAAEFLKPKAEEQKIIFVLSDGYPFGYPNVYDALEEATKTYEGKGVIIIGIGLDTERMGTLFRYNAAVYSQRDLIKKVGDIFLQASSEELI